VNCKWDAQRLSLGGRWLVGLCQWPAYDRLTGTFESHRQLLAIESSAHSNVYSIVVSNDWWVVRTISIVLPRVSCRVFPSSGVNAPRAGSHSSHCRSHHSGSAVIGTHANEQLARRTSPSSQSVIGLSSGFTTVCMTY